MVKKTPIIIIGADDGDQIHSRVSQSQTIELNDVTPTTGTEGDPIQTGQTETISLNNNNNNIDTTDMNI